jgi:nicotinamidase-related amidase
MPQPVLVVINVQERLFDAMDADRRDDMIRNTKILGIAARRLGMPVQQAGS